MQYKMSIRRFAVHRRTHKPIHSTN